MQGNMIQGIRMNPGSYTVHQSGLNDLRKDLLKKAIDGNDPSVFRADNLASAIKAEEGRKESEDQTKNMAKFLQTIGLMTAGRGVNKALQTPAQLNGINLQNPQFFNMQPKQPIPYQKIIADKQNLDAVLSKYQEVTNENGGPQPADAANIIANVRRSQSIIGEAMNKYKTESIYAGVSKSAAKNLYDINIRNQRMNSIYALQ